MEQKNNKSKKEYLEILQTKEEMELRIMEMEETISSLKKSGSKNQMDMVFLKKVMHLAGYKFNIN